MKKLIVFILFTFSFESLSKQSFFCPRDIIVVNDKEYVKVVPRGGTKIDYLLRIPKQWKKDLERAIRGAKLMRACLCFEDFHKDDQNTEEFLELCKGKYVDL